ncbi:MAG: peptidase M23 [Leptospiraceae bacterium]|nr:peptidase M23 [Leptospiraceae bacterium]
MHHRRFKNRHSKHRFELQGRFSLIHLGGGSFLYSFPGKTRPIIGRVDLALGKIRNQALGVMALSVLFFGVFSLLSNSGTATTTQELTEVEELKKMEGKLSPIELEKKSDALKEKLLTEDQPDGKDGKVIKYTVRNGDTLSQISAKFKVPMKLIARSNEMGVHSVLRPGQKLTIPNRPGLTYKIKKNDRIAKVAEYYSVKLEDIRKDNPDVANLDLLKPGETIFLPNAKVPEPPPTWFRPVWGRTTSGYGWRIHPIYRYRQFHGGIDVAARYTWIHSARNGVVTYAGWMGSYGRAIIIKHDNGLKTLYAHLSRINVRVGQSVKGGQRIGVSGSTGMSTGPHLHFEVIRNGKPVDPRRYIKF